MDVLVVEDYADLSRDAARLVAEPLRARPGICLGLPAGNTPRGMYRELIRMRDAGEIDFSGVSTFNLDEFVGIPPEDPRSFHHFMTENFWRPAGLASDRTLILDGMAEDPEDECARYEEQIRRRGGIDLLVAGIGVNGHIAFNEPGFSFRSRTRKVRLADATPAPVGEALTMGIGTILEARKILLLASGETKAEAIRGALSKPPTTDLPASALQLHGDVTVMADGAAAQLL